MADLDEKQYEVGGVVFGLDADVMVKSDGFQPGSAAIATQDVAMPSSDGVRMGRDFYGGATWSFGLFANADTEEAAYDMIAELGAVWPPEEIRQNPRAVMALRMNLRGKQMRIYGRPRRWTPSYDNLSLSGRIDVAADFATTDHLIYEDELNSVDVGLVPPDDPELGLIPPFIAPFTTTPRSGARQGEITVGGDRPTWAVVTFTGPVQDAHLQVTYGTPMVGPKGLPILGWEAALIDPVAPGAQNAVTIDSRPWERSVTRPNGGGVRVSPRVTKLSAMLLPPGTHELVFTGIDDTNTAEATVSWRNARRSL